MGIVSVSRLCPSQDLNKDKNCQIKKTEMTVLGEMQQGEKTKEISLERAAIICCFFIPLLSLGSLVSVPTSARHKTAFASSLKRLVCVRGRQWDGRNCYESCLICVFTCR